jgi:tetratricopeptide (TPR) repeat protein
VNHKVLPSLLFVFFVGTLVAQDEEVAKASAAMKAEDYDSAISILEAVYEQVAVNKAALQMLTEAYVKGGHYGKALDTAVRLADLDSSNPEAYRLGAIAFYWSAEEAKQDAVPDGSRIEGFFEESVIMNRKYLELKPKDVDQWSLLGHANNGLGRWKDAAKAFATCAELQPDEAGHLLNAVVAYRADSDFDAAVKTLDKGLAKNAEDPTLLRAKAETLILKDTDAGKDEAGSILAKALASKSIEPAAAGECANLLWRAFGPRSSWQPALAATKGWVAAHPADKTAWWWQGFYEGRAGDHKASLASLTKSWELSKRTLATAATEAAAACFNLAAPPGSDGQPDGSRIDMKRMNEAFQWLCKAHLVEGWNWSDPATSPMGRLQGYFIFLINNGKLKEGAGLIENTVIKEVKDSWRMYNNLGLFYRDEGESKGGSVGKELCKKSAAYYSRAVDLVVDDPAATGPEKAQILNDAGLLYHFPQYQIRDIDKGMGLYERALTFDPNYIDANENMGIVLNSLGRFKDAIPYLEKAIALSKDGRPVSRRELQRAKRGGGD